MATLTWLLWPSGPAWAQSRRVFQFAASVDPWTKATSDVVLTGLELPQGVTIDPEFESDTHSYTLTVPASLEQLGFTGRFTSSRYDDGPPGANGYGRGYGLATVGTSAELHTKINGNNSDHVVTTDQTPFWRPRIVSLQPLGSSTTIVISVYKRLPGRAKERRLHDPTNSVWENYTLTVEREVIQQ